MLTPTVSNSKMNKELENEGQDPHHLGLSMKMTGKSKWKPGKLKHGGSKPKRSLINHLAA
jgi:hypothetical protein